MKLCKSLYGLRQSPKNWRSTIDIYVMKIGFKPLKSDPCVYVYYPDDDSINITAQRTRARNRRPSSPSTSTT